MKQLALALTLTRELDFDEFFAGPNVEALAAVRAWSVSAEPRFVYLCGPAGTGKSHLLQAACRFARARGCDAVYLPLDHPAFLPGVMVELEETALVALDGLEAIVGQPRWEVGLFNLYNRLRETGRGLLVSARVPLGELPVTLADLRSRLGWGPGYRLRSLGDEDCAGLMALAAGRRGLSLGAAEIGYLLRHSRREPEHLLRLLDVIDRASLADKRRPTLGMIRRLLAGSS